MILLVKHSVVAVTLLSVVTAVSMQSAVAASTSDRLDSIERKLDSRGLLDMLNRVEQMHALVNSTWIWTGVCNNSNPVRPDHRQRCPRPL